ncbi:glycosyltransferase [Bacillus methanolicus]|uniref:Glycosyl transferase domain-containing protein n=1 Tax=Bacillus methanolicus (strain MGA3 / ATCC 53907) TaxID=796606 RepID=I3EAH6_BACMM|nr:glycosyltransferase [Bacillus methanolicus]AIE60737.1 glycosyl transferase domain-containing protein [Bacillus methanolicus MGA3]EIJ83497.1 glycosyl transferase domain protein [Bacillus methanolicus MGA3]
MMRPFFLPILYTDMPLISIKNNSNVRKDLFVFTAKLIEILFKLENEPQNLKIYLAIPPIYYEVAGQEIFQAKMTEFLEKETDQFPGLFDIWMKWDQSVIKSVQSLINQEKIELLALPVTGAVLPFAATSAGIQAHIREGLSILESCFSVRPSGFWFPKGAFEPGLDLFLMNEGIQYSFINEDTIKFADPTPSGNGKKPIRSPHGLIFFPIQKEFELGGSYLEKYDSNVSVYDSKQVFTAAHNLSSEEIVSFFNLVKNMAINPSVSMEVSSFLKEYGETAETAHICPSFLAADDSSPLITDESTILEECFLMETEIKKISTLVENSFEKRILKQMLKHWLLLSGIAAGSGQTQEAAEEHITSFNKLKEILVGNRQIFELDDMENSDSILVNLSLKGWINEAKSSLTTNESKRQDLKILMLTWEFPPNIVGGLARHVHGLSESLAKLGYEIHVITAQSEDLPSFEKRDGVFIHRVAPLNEKDDDFLAWVAGLNLAMANRARELAAVHDFQVIHAHDWLVGSAAISLKSLLNIPLITTMHATEHGRNNGIYTDMQHFIHKKEEILLQASDKAIVCSEYMKDELKYVFNTSEEKIAIIPNGVFKHVGQLDLHGLLDGLPVFPERKMIFSIGRMVREKGFDTLIEAATKMKAKSDELYFVIAGKGPLLEEYRQKVKDYGLENFVYFIGFIQDEQRDALLTQCEAAVFPSLYEPFGIVALEAMSFGKPTIVSETGGLKGIIQPYKTGLFMDPGNSLSLLQQLHLILEDRQRALEIGENGRKVVESLFSWTRIAEETKRTFEDVLLSTKI